MTSGDLAELQAAMEAAYRSLAATVRSLSPETSVVRANVRLPEWMPVGVSMVCKPADFDGSGEVVEITLAVYPPDERIPVERLACDVYCTDGTVVVEMSPIPLDGPRGSADYRQSGLEAIQEASTFLDANAHAIVAELARHPGTR